MKSVNVHSNIVKLKLQAFTLIEVIVVIAISIFFIGIVYTSVLFYTSTIKKTEADSEAHRNIIELQTNLMHEAGSSMLMVCNQKDSGILFVTPSLDTISYYFHATSILRKQRSRNDTIHVSVNSVSYFWRGNPQSKGYTDQMDLNINYANTILSVVITKEYSPDILYNFIENLSTLKQ